MFVLLTIPLLFSSSRTLDGWRKKLTSLSIHFSFACHVGFVPHQQFDAVSVAVEACLIEPVRNLLEALLIRDVKHDHQPLGPAVKAGHDGPEPGRKWVGEMTGTWTVNIKSSTTIVKQVGDV